MFYKRRDPQSLLEPKTLGFIMTHTENPLVSVSICSAFSSRKDPSVHFFSAFCHFNTVPKRRAYGSIFCCEWEDIIIAKTVRDHKFTLFPFILWENLGPDDFKIGLKQGFIFPLKQFLKKFLKPNLFASQSGPSRAARSASFCSKQSGSGSIWGFCHQIQIYAGNPKCPSTL